MNRISKIIELIKSKKEQIEKEPYGEIRITWKDGSVKLSRVEWDEVKVEKEEI